MRPTRRRVALTVAALAATTLGIAAVVHKPASRATVASSLPAYPLPGTEHTLTIEVLNGTSRTGLARIATRQLRQAGFDVVYVPGTGPAGPAVRASRVIARRVDAKAARAVALALGIENVVAIRDTMRRVDVSVWLGEDYRAPTDLHP